MHRCHVLGKIQGFLLQEIAERRINCFIFGRSGAGLLSYPQSCSEERISSHAFRQLFHTERGAEPFLFRIWASSRVLCCKCPEPAALGLGWGLPAALPPRGHTLLISSYKDSGTANRDSLHRVAIWFLSYTQLLSELHGIAGSQAQPLVPGMTLSLTGGQLNFNLVEWQFVFPSLCLYLQASDFQIYWSTPTVNTASCNFYYCGEWIPAEHQKNKTGRVNFMAWIYPAVIEINTWMVQFHLNETHADCESDKYFIYTYIYISTYVKISQSFASLNLHQNFHITL